MYRYITGNVDAEQVNLSSHFAGAAGSHDDVVLRLTFDDMWDGLTITALWIDSRGENPVTTAVTVTDNVADILIPKSPKAYQGELTFCLKGATVENTTETRATMTVSTKMSVGPSLY